VAHSDEGRRTALARYREEHKVGGNRTLSSIVLGVVKIFGRFERRILHHEVGFENTQKHFEHFISSGTLLALSSLETTIVIWNKTGVCAMLDQQVDDKGTDQEEAKSMLTTLRDEAFDGDNQKFAVALGRTVEQVQGMISGAETIDDDVVMKARGIALNRGIEIERESES
jgi:hypothetical protein